MKVVAFNGSPRKEGNTYNAIKIVTSELEKEGILTEIIHVGNQPLSGCMACGSCGKNQDERCVLPEEAFNEWVQKAKEADGIILGSPVHYSSIAANMKSFLDRLFYVAGANKGLLRHKVGASVAAVRRSGGVATFHQLNTYLNYAEMFIPSSNYWNVIHGAAPGEALQDEEGVQIMRVLGKNMAYLLKLLEKGKDKVQAPEPERKVFTNFVR